MMTTQLELTFDGSASFQPRMRHRCPLSLARWWFDRMHRTVAAAMSLKELRRARSEQQQLALSSPATTTTVRFNPRRAEPLAPAA
ncbi:MAG: hypothetical protein H7A46_09265 [Verrucomicrobiales bacterium]|nr:hypothetical protein [Verrucomicrobiales bacterium]